MTRDDFLVEAVQKLAKIVFPVKQSKN